MTAIAEQALRQLLGAALAAGEVTIEGDKVYRGGIEVAPRLGFERVQSDRRRSYSSPATPADAGIAAQPLRGIRLSAGEQTEDDTMTNRHRNRTYVPPPAPRLIPSDPAVAQRQQQAAERHARTAGVLHRSGRQRAQRPDGWPSGGAPLPADRLLREGK